MNLGFTGARFYEHSVQEHNSGDLCRLAKYQSLGNDYLVLDRPAQTDRVVAVLPRLCDRHLGLGADGLLVLDPAALALRVFNPDRSEAEKSGNGLRIAAAHAVLAHAAGAEFAIRTTDRSNPVRVLAVEGGRVTTDLDLGAPVFDPDQWLTLETGLGSVRCRLVAIGNPHCVVFDQPVTPQHCRRLGPLIENHPRFPRRTNVQLVEVLGRDSARIEIWERGAGYTLASGSSSAAVAGVLMHLGLADPGVTIHMPGGSLAVTRDAGGSLHQQAAADRIALAELDLRDLRG